MINRPLYIRKYHSERLKEFDYCINDTFEQSKSLNEIAGLADNQILRTIRDVTKRSLDKEKLEILITLRHFYESQLTYQQSSKGHKTAAAITEKLNQIKAKNKLTWRLYRKYVHIAVYSDEASRLQKKIERTLFHEDYITVVMDTKKQYEFLYHNGFQVNGKTYRRLSCSAGQARVSTVVFCNETILPEVRRRLNNGRNMEKKLSPSKFNAYFGLYGSSTNTVSEPPFLVVKDYENTASFMANYVIENGKNVDDTIIQKEMKHVPMNRTDGMGLISYKQAEKWAKELDLDYIPSQFCIRQSFIKGMLCVFPIHEFARTYGKLDEHGRCMVDTIYCDQNGCPVKKNLFDYEVIISESQFKLWDSFDSAEQYIKNCHENNLLWGISLTSPKEAKHMLKLNYQFIQTLNLSEEDIKELAAPFVRWIKGVSYENRYYMLLFLLGINNDEEKIQQFLKYSEAYWVKALLLNDNIKNDKYIRTKIRELLKRKIECGCKGDIYTDGNFQVIVSDPFGFMQHVCGLEVTGLLKPGMSYSNYWNERGVSQVDAMRSPLTYLSEHVLLNLQRDQETEHWYRYCKLGIILNYHGNETFHFAGSDFDFDILATTSDKTMIKGIYKEELPVVYDGPKPEKIHFTEDDLYKADTFSFGSIIGSITNKSSNGYALLPLIKEKYGENSQQYRLVKSRLQQCCKAQSAQIDKAKIGREVKGIPRVWTDWNRIKKSKKDKITDHHKNRKELYNAALLNTYPYFFRYVYKDTKTAYKKYLDEANTISRQKFRLTFRDLEALSEKTDEQERFIADFYKYCPVTVSKSPMNMLCQYIEETDFQISRHIKTTDTFDFECYKSNHTDYLAFYEKIAFEMTQFMKELHVSATVSSGIKEGQEDNENSIEDAKNRFYIICHMLFNRMAAINTNPYIITNGLVDYFYKEHPSSNKDLLWQTYGKYICRNIQKHSDSNSVLFPMAAQGSEGDFEYLGYRYQLQEVKLEL